MGPGVGGMKAWVVAKPASKGMPKYSSERPVRRPKAYTSGTSRTKATSKNTGIATRKPVRTKAKDARFSPKRASRNRASAWLPPECSNTAPRMAPKPTIVATKPRVPPMPVVMLVMISDIGMPAERPKPMLAMSKAKKAFNRKRSTRSSRRAMLKKMAEKSCSVISYEE